MSINFPFVKQLCSVFSDVNAYFPFYFHQSKAGDANYKFRPKAKILYCEFFF